MSSNAGAAFLGNQGDIWDAQKDMLANIYDRGRPAALRLSGPEAGRGPRLAPMLANPGQDFAAAPAQHCFGHGNAQGLRFGGGFDGLDFLYVLLAA